MRAMSEGARERGDVGIPLVGDSDGVGLGRSRTLTESDASWNESVALGLACKARGAEGGGCTDGSDEAAAISIASRNPCKLICRGPDAQ